VTARDQALEDVLEAARCLKTDPDAARLRIISLVEEIDRLDELADKEMQLTPKPRIFLGTGTALTFGWLLGTALATIFGWLFPFLLH
jgi:hypothetical protein